MLSHLAVIIICLVGVSLADTSYDSTTTITLTPEITLTTTIGYIEETFETAYIYTNSYISLTTTTATGSTRYALVTGSSFPTASPSISASTDTVPTVSTSLASLVSAVASDVESDLNSAISFKPSSVVSTSGASESTYIYASLSFLSTFSGAKAEVLESTTSITKGDYSTSTSATTTTFQDGSSALIKYVVLHTVDC